MDVLLCDREATIIGIMYVGFVFPNQLLKRLYYNLAT